MPVTVRLSRLFHERFGDEIADEIANWFNQVDSTYRADLREHNELNFSRFDAKVEQRLAEVRGEIGRQIAELEVTTGRQIAELEVKIGRQMADLRAELLGAMADLRGRLMTWMVGLWITSALGLAGIVFTALRLR